MQQRSQSQRMPASNMSSFSHPPGHQPVHPQGHHSASMQQLPPQSTNMVHVQGGGVNPSMMSRPGMVPMHQASQPMPMMSSSMPSSGYHTMAANSNGQPMNSMPGVPPMQSNYMQPQQQAQGMPMQHPSQAMGQPVPQTQAANGKPKGEIKKRAMVQEFLNRAMKLQMISSLEAESYMAEWMKVEVSLSCE